MYLAIDLVGQPEPLLSNFDLDVLNSPLLRRIVQCLPVKTLILERRLLPARHGTRRMPTVEQIDLVDGGLREEMGNKSCA